MGSNSGVPAPELPAFYAPLGPRLSQGDIVRGVPWGLIDSPVLICHSRGAGGRSQTTPMSELPSAFRKKPTEDIHARAQMNLSMVLWHDCELDKFMEQGRSEEKWFGAIAPVVALTDTFPEEHLRKAVREGQRRPYFPLPANEGLEIPESYVDLRHIWSVKQSILADRMISLNEPSRAALYGHLFTFLTHLAPRDDAICPHCSKRLAFADLLVSVGE
jgi:hypothetical protein